MFHAFKFFCFSFFLGMLLILVAGSQLDKVAAASPCVIGKSDTPKLFKWHFASNCDEDKSTILTEELLRTIGQGRSIDVKGAHIVGDLNFISPHIPIKFVSGREVKQVDGILRFEDCTFQGLIKTGKVLPVLFVNEVSFINSSFLQPADFENSVFKRGLNFDRSEFFSDSNFKGIEVQGNVSFFTTRFYGKDMHLLFDAAWINGDLIFQNATVEMKSLFAGIRVAGQGNFKRTKFKNTLNFGPLGEIPSKFSKKLDFYWADLQNPSFIKTEFQGEVIFDETAFLGTEANFESAIFEKHVHFSCRSLPQSVILRNAKFRSLLDFRESSMESVEIIELSKETKISEIRLDWDKWYESAIWFWFPFLSPSPTVLEGRNLDNRSTNNPADIIRLYKTIEKGMRKQGDAAAANEVYYRRKLLERRENSFPRKTLEWMVRDLLFGYTVRISRPFWASIAVWLIMACVFRRWSIFRRETHEWSLRLVQLPLRYHQRTIPCSIRKASFVWYLILSSVILTKINLGGEYITNSRSCLTLAKIEWFLGLLLIAALFTCLILNLPEFERLLRSAIG